MRVAISGTHCCGKSTLIDAFLLAHSDYVHEPEAYVALQDMYDAIGPLSIVVDPNLQGFIFIHPMLYPAARDLVRSGESLRDSLTTCLSDGRVIKDDEAMTSLRRLLSVLAEALASRAQSLSRNAAFSNLKNTSVFC